MASLIQQYNDEAIRRLEITKDLVVIGRANDADLVLNDPGISRYHSQIRKRGNMYFLTDLNSSNGSYIQNKRILQAWLLDGDEMIIGRFIVKFEDKHYLYDGANQIPDEQRMLYAYEEGHKDVSKAKEWAVEISGGSFDKTERVIRSDFLIGKGYNCDITLEGKDILPIHVLIIKYEESLYVLNFAKKHNVAINNSPASKETSLTGLSVMTIDQYTLTFTPKDFVSGSASDTLPVGRP